MNYRPENNENLSADTTAEIAKLLRLEKDVVRKISAAGKKLPLARAESEKEAEIVQNRLRAHEVETFIVRDETLAADKLPRRLRGVDFRTAGSC